ncbi:hypothetical protein DSO57_1022081 [Entomophthora muscae]|uniref:Uncharacterized protein n=1 Tax=Entomophthora muscae TaxID=34485 RepID=A0ACC2TRN3_9FUNG|nr:hypothetical protein DSO57_1022081 [Entomophthora muscae]
MEWLPAPHPFQSTLVIEEDNKMNKHNTPLECEELKAHMERIKHNIDKQIKCGNYIRMQETMKQVPTNGMSKPKVTSNGLSASDIMKKLTFTVTLEDVFWISPQWCQQMIQAVSSF